MFFGSLLLGQLPHLPSPQLRTKCFLGRQLSVHSEHHTGSKSKAALFSGCQNYDLEKKLLHFFPKKYSGWSQWASSRSHSSLPALGDLLQSPLRPMYEMRTIRRLLRSHNWSTFIHIKGWKSLRLLTVRCFYSSHLPPTYRFQISPNWITKSTPGDLSCPSSIYHICFKWITF